MRFVAMAVLGEVAVIVAILGVMPTCAQVPVVLAFPVRMSDVALHKV
jgi:hypothetical protein